jgi:hypothetical protein
MDEVCEGDEVVEESWISSDDCSRDEVAGESGPSSSCVPMRIFISCN